MIDLQELKAAAQKQTGRFDFFRGISPEDLLALIEVYEQRPKVEISDEKREEWISGVEGEEMNIEELAKNIFKDCDDYWGWAPEGNKQEMLEIIVEGLNIARQSGFEEGMEIAEKWMNDYDKLKNKYEPLVAVITEVKK